MYKYQNAMESLVEDKFDELRDSFSCCTCEQCRNDIIAYALNHLPPKYVVTTQGQLYSKMNLLGIQFTTDIAMALAQGARIISMNPRHNLNGDAEKTIG